MKRAGYDREYEIDFIKGISCIDIRKWFQDRFRMQWDLHVTSKIQQC